MEKKMILLSVSMCFFALFFTAVSAYADFPMYQEGFEGSSGWSADNGVWEIGIPTSGPGESHGGLRCAGTVLGGDYYDDTDSRLIVPYQFPWEQGIELPNVSGKEEIHLRFWQWFSYSNYNYTDRYGTPYYDRYDKGHVQISVYNETTESWSDWQTLSSIQEYSPLWTKKDVDLTAYAGQKVRIAFYHTESRSAETSSVSFGWYIDDVQIITKVPELTGNFESGWDDWSAENGVWEVGTPTSGPENAYKGVNCVGTVLSGHYPKWTESRLISPAVVLSNITSGEELHLRFWQWFSYSNYNYTDRYGHPYYDSYDQGHVQISVYDETTESWSDWQTLSSIQEYSPLWTKKDVNLTAFAGQKVKIAFYHTESIYSSISSVGFGWYIDDVQIITKVPEFTGNFESGWDDWSADNGVWEVGTPTSGAENPYEGAICVGTVLSGHYPDWTDSRLISPTVVLSNITSGEELYLRFWQWFSYSNYNYTDRYGHPYYDRYDQGHVQISVYDETTESWSDWQTLSSIQEYSPLWTKKDVNLTAYAGQKVRVAFYHAESIYSSVSSVSFGWYIDDIEIITKVPEFTGDFEKGWIDWSASNGVWQVGTPTSGPEGCYAGDQCAGTVLDGNYPTFTDSRLVSAPIDLTDCSPSIAYLKFWEWFSYSNDFGEVQISTWDTESAQWSEWIPLIQSTVTSHVWTLKYVDLSAYTGNVFRIGFYHSSDSSSTTHGWFIDNLELVGPTGIMPEINYVSFVPYIPDACPAFIDVFASDPCGGELTYTWQLPDGGTLVEPGASTEFVPPEITIEPYRVRVAVSSPATHISSFTRTLKIYTAVLYDLDYDDDIDGADLHQFLKREEIDETTLTRLADEFGMIGCQQ